MILKSFPKLKKTKDESRIWIIIFFSVAFVLFALSLILYNNSSLQEKSQPAKAAYSWTIETVDSLGDVGDHSSLALDNLSNPSISYDDLTAGFVKYAKWSGSGWNIQTVDTGSDASLVLDSSGNPHLAYYSEPVLKYAEWNGSSWDVQTVDGGLSPVFFSAQIRLDSTNQPHICYTGDGLKYAKWNGTSWEIEVVEASGMNNERPIDCALALDSTDTPHIAYAHTKPYGMASPIPHELKYAKWNGSGWDIEVVDDSSATTGLDPSIQIDSTGKPHISYWNNNENLLRYAKWNGSVWELQTVDDIGKVGRASSLALDSNDNPRISYLRDYPFHELKLAEWDGTSWKTETVASLGENESVDYVSSLALDNLGNPRLSYVDATNLDLKYASGILAPTPTATVIVSPTATNTPEAVVGPQWAGSRGDNRGTNRAAISGPAQVQGIKWRRSDAAFSPPAVANDNTLYSTAKLSTNHYQLVAINSDGTTKWTYDILIGGAEVDSVSAPVIAFDGSIYFTAWQSSSSTSKLFKILDAGISASYQWEFTLVGQGSSEPAVDSDGSIYVASDDVFKITSAGTQVWRVTPLNGHNNPTKAVLPPVLAGDYVISGVHGFEMYFDQGIFSLRKTDGHQMWWMGTFYSYANSHLLMVLDDDTVVMKGAETGGCPMPSSQGYIRLLDAGTGVLKGSFYSTAGFSLPVSLDKVGAVGKNNNFYSWATDSFCPPAYSSFQARSALAPYDPKWEFTLPRTENVSSVIVDKDGTLYIATALSASFKIYAVSDFGNSYEILPGWPIELPGSYPKNMSIGYGSPPQIYLSGNGEIIALGEVPPTPTATETYTATFTNTATPTFTPSYTFTPFVSPTDTPFVWPTETPVEMETPIETLVEIPSETPTAEIIAYITETPVPSGGEFTPAAEAGVVFAAPSAVSSGAISAAVALQIVLALISLGAFNIWLFLVQLLSLLIDIISGRKRRTWGIVYDSRVKNPLPQALVRIYDTEYKRLKETQVTSASGKFGFLVPNGKYYITVAKQDYLFPSILVQGKEDGYYLDVYHGEEFEIKETSETYTVSIPLDQVSLVKQLRGWAALWVQLKKNLRYINYIFFVIVMDFSLFTLYFNYSTFVLVSTILYLVIFALVVYSERLKRRSWGIVYDKKTRQPLAVALIRFFDKKGKLLGTKVTTEKGTFTFLLSPGVYDITVVREGYKEYRREVRVTKEFPFVGVDIGMDKEK